MTEYLDPADVEWWIQRNGLHIRDRGVLLSALASPLPVFGEEVYESLHEKGAALFLAVNRNHPLLDGNKRLSWIVVAAFSGLNGLDLRPDDDTEAYIRAIAAGDVSETREVADWLERHAHPEGSI